MLTSFENFSITRELTGYLDELNKTGTVQGMVFSRGIGFVALPFTCLADASVHISFAALKIITGLGALFYNLAADCFYPDYRISREYELSSSLLHVILTIQSLVRIVFFSFLCLLDPQRTNSLVQEPLTPNPV